MDLLLGRELRDTADCAASGLCIDQLDHKLASIGFQRYSASLLDTNHVRAL